jgi:hypothetical protein
MSERDKSVPPPPLARVGRLDTLSAVLTEMASVYRECRSGAMDISSGAKLTYMLRCMRDVLETITIEKLEKRMDEATTDAVERAVARRSERPSLQ